MADKFHFDLVSPERRVMSGEVDRVVVPGEEGVFEVLPKHAPFMAVVHPGVVEAVNGADHERIFVMGGFADVTPDGLTVLAEQAIPVGELNADDIAGRLKDAEEDLADADTEAKRRTAQTAIDRLKEMQGVL